MKLTVTVMLTGPVITYLQGGPVPWNLMSTLDPRAVTSAFNDDPLPSG